MEVEIRLGDLVVLTNILGVFIDGKRKTSGNIDTLDRIGPANFSKIGNRTAEREEFTLLVVFTVDNGARHVGVDFKISETERFITSTLIVVNVDFNFSSFIEVRNNDGDGFGTVIPTSTTRVNSSLCVNSLVFVNNLTINVDNN